MLSNVITVLALAMAAQAMPTAPTVPAVSGQTTSSVPAIHNTNFQRNGTTALLRAYAKHNLTPTKNVSDAFKSALASRIEKRQSDGTAPASDDGGIEYLVQTVIGGQTLNMDFDTGSSDLWVFSSSLSTKAKGSHNIFTPSQSSTWKAKSGYTWSITYADGSGASGTVGTDTVNIGGTIVTGQAVELATKVSSSFTSGDDDGLVGLAFDGLNTVSPVKQKTFFSNAAPFLNSPIFTAYLPNNRDGSYDFGFLDSTKHSGSVVYTTVSTVNNFWEYPSTSYKVGSSVFSQSGWTGISDTGTTLVLMGDDAVDNYYSFVSGASFDSDAGGYTFPCSATLPSLSIRIGPTNYATIPGSYINFSTSSGNTCFGGLQSVGGGSQAIYGDIFFNANYAVFDSSVPRFGFAPLV